MEESRQAAESRVDEWLPSVCSNYDIELFSPENGADHVPEPTGFFKIRGGRSMTNLKLFSRRALVFLVRVFHFRETAIAAIGDSE